MFTRGVSREIVRGERGILYGAKVGRKKSVEACLRKFSVGEGFHGGNVWGNYMRRKCPMELSGGCADPGAGRAAVFVHRD